VEPDGGGERGELAAKVDVTALTQAGTEIATVRLDVAAGARLADTAEAIFGASLGGVRHFRFNSDRKVIVFALTGSADGRGLDGLGAFPPYVP